MNIPDSPPVARATYRTRTWIDGVEVIEPRYATLDDLRAEHDRIMATPPLAYRGYTIKPTSHWHQPHHDGWLRYYWGWNVIDARGCNAGPGATWGQTVDEARHIVDCLYEAGPKPSAPPIQASREEQIRVAENVLAQHGPGAWGVRRAPLTRRRPVGLHVRRSPGNPRPTRLRVPGLSACPIVESTNACV